MVVSNVFFSFSKGIPFVSSGHLGCLAFTTVRDCMAEEVPSSPEVPMVESPTKSEKKTKFQGLGCHLAESTQISLWDVQWHPAARARPKQFG